MTLKHAIVLLSGGLDSATVGAIAKSLGFELHALTINYHQRHLVELEAAKRVAAFLQVKQHHVLEVDLARFGGSALTVPEMAVPKNVPPLEIGQHVPVTYVPARNTVFLAIALSFAEAAGAKDIFIGVSEVDSSGYPDCRKPFLAKFEELANLATASTDAADRYRIHAPLIELSKADIIRRGIALGVDYGLTHTCYDPFPTGGPCRACESCLLRQKGFAEAGVADPLL